MATIYPDADVRNADWAKRTWDLVEVNNVEELREHLKRTGTTVEQFKRLPVYRLNVDKLPWLREL